MKNVYEMDKLDIAAMDERVNKLIDQCSKEAIDAYMEYGEVVQMLWEAEFKPLSLRVQEVTAKFPSPVIRVAFLRNILHTVVGPLSAHDAAGLLFSIATDICAHTRAVYRANPMQILGIAADSSEQPGLR